MRILIVRLGAFGDLIHTLPLAADLKRHGVQIDWVCDQPWKLLFEGNPAIDQCFTIPRKQWKRKSAIWSGEIYRSIKQLRQQLQERHYDVVIDAQGRLKSALIALLSGARARISHQWPVANEGSYLLSQRRCPASPIHIVDKMRTLGLPILGAVPARADWEFPLPAWTEEKLWAANYIQAQSLNQNHGKGTAAPPWIWNVGGTWPTKLWPLAQQQALLTLLIDHGHQVIVTWGPGWEQQHAEQLCQAETRAHLAPNTTLRQLAGLISQAGMMLSCDTGPLHLAMALGIPAVGLFGPVPAERNGPRGRGYRNIQAPGELWERRDVSKVNMAAISPQQVYQEALLALAERQ